ncbi:MAG: ATP-dependent DNA ligase [Myxococcales bacterium]|nr:ATP-dependent DNA ligase [Myxococcales bacterium]
MRRFADLYAALDATTKTSLKLAALARYFASAPHEDAAWAVHFLSGWRLTRLVGYRKLAGWAMQQAALSEWLFGECYDSVGDLAETIALVLPPPARQHERGLAETVRERLLPLRGLDDDAARALIVESWDELDEHQRFVFNKLLTGALRVGVSQRLVTRALSLASGVPVDAIAHRLMCAFEPSAAAYRALIDADTEDADQSRPYPFFLASPLEGDPAEQLGERALWQAEWKWDGIRAQLIRRAGATYIWSRGEELVTERFPELDEMARSLSDGSVLDGEIVVWRDDLGGVQPFSEMQRRIGRKKLGKKLLAEVPVALVAYDLLERPRSRGGARGDDLRDVPQRERREALEAVVVAAAHPRLRLSPLVEAPDWPGLAAQRERAEDRGVEGLMLKRLDASYGVGRKRGGWWKWKVAPYTIDAVLTYAQRGSGRRARLYTDYTFGVWRDGELVTIAKAYSGLSDDEIRQVDRFVRDNTLERFGPVRQVKAELVFELAFDSMQRSKRHKSGVAVRFPRIARWRHDKPAAEADSLETIEAMLARREQRAQADADEVGA